MNYCCTPDRLDKEADPVVQLVEIEKADDVRDKILIRAWLV